jgi:hypothetical protein
VFLSQQHQLGFQHAMDTVVGCHSSQDLERVSGADPDTPTQLSRVYAFKALETIAKFSPMQRQDVYYDEDGHQNWSKVVSACTSSVDALTLNLQLVVAASQQRSRLETDNARREMKNYPKKHGSSGFGSSTDVFIREGQLERTATAVRNQDLYGTPYGPKPTATGWTAGYHFDGAENGAGEMADSRAWQADICVRKFLGLREEADRTIDWTSKKLYPELLERATFGMGTMVHPGSPCFTQDGNIVFTQKQANLLLMLDPHSKKRVFQMKVPQPQVQCVLMRVCGFDFALHDNPSLNGVVEWRR